MASGLPNLRVDVHSVRAWTMGAQVAERFQVSLSRLSSA